MRWWSDLTADMREIQIGCQTVLAKDYECSQDETYVLREQIKLWLYVNLTDTCPAGCPFCVHAPTRQNPGHLNPERLRQVLSIIAHQVSGVSLTGGEPMLDLPLLEDVIAVVQKSVSADIELDIVTNGYHLEALPALRGIDRFATIHVSRHAVDDETNAALMNWQDAPTRQLLQEVFANLHDPGAVVLNCVLQKQGVHDLDSAMRYLEMAAEIGAANVSFISMFPVNNYCRDHYVSPGSIDFQAERRFAIWNQFHDYGYCRCITGDYRAGRRYIRFYSRCPGGEPAPRYCRQLVYGADDKLRQGFGNAAVIDV